MTLNKEDAAPEIAGWQKQYHWQRTWPGEKDLDGKPFEDYVCYDGNQYAGRIRLDRQTLKRGQWQWSGSCPRPMFGSPNMPNGGWSPNATDAAHNVEKYWNGMKAKLSR